MRRLRHIVANGTEPVDADVRSADGFVVPTASSADAMRALRSIRERLGALEADVAELHRWHETLVSDVAGALIDCLDARWARAVDDRSVEEPGRDSAPACAGAEGQDSMLISR